MVVDSKGNITCNACENGIKKSQSPNDTHFPPLPLVFLAGSSCRLVADSTTSTFAMLASRGFLALRPRSSRILSEELDGPIFAPFLPFPPILLLHQHIILLRLVQTSI
jgi:hypothetical protein